jgi:chorismate dehydratase
MRIAASTYLNSAPLVYGFAHGSQRHLVKFMGDAAPSRCARMLSDGKCDIALIPVIEYQRTEGLRIIPDVAVASKERVRSVILAARCPLAEAQVVTLDSSSRTSQTLTRILFAKLYGASPQFIERTPDSSFDCENMLEGSDAALVIGDPAFRLKAVSSRYDLETYDLAEEWRKLTGLPFVFAVWAAREGICQSAGFQKLDFAASRREGLQRIDEITRLYSERLRQPQAELLGYLQESVNFHLDRENLRGLQRFYEFAYECGLIENVHALQFADLSSVNSDSMTE